MFLKIYETNRHYTNRTDYTDNSQLARTKKSDWQVSDTDFLYVAVMIEQGTYI